jgi:3-dehydroquinate dehydratase-2
MLGKRETSVYGNQTLKELESFIVTYGQQCNADIKCFQSNSESGIIDEIHKALDMDAIIINAGAYTHTSVAIRDALLAVNKPFIEVHISNVFKREPFRHHSYLSDIAEAVITGLGFSGYIYAVDYLINKLK